jgi:hypothetical protein
LFSFTKTYAGVGSRETPPVILQAMTELAQWLADRGYTLRSGGAGGADAAFEKGAGDQKEIFLPYDGFNGRKVDNVQFFNYTKDAARIARKYHPHWDTMGYASRRFHARNSHQVLGLSLNHPVDFLVCYTKGGKMIGGTAQAMRIAKDHNIPIFNFATMTLADIKFCITELEKE